MTTFPIIDDQAEYAARARAAVFVDAMQDVAVPARLGLPDGLVQISWHTFDGFEQTREVTQWRRIDQGLMSQNGLFQITVQARQYRDLRLPLYSVTATARLTCEREDTEVLHVGDSARANGWRFGVRLIGAVLIPQHDTGVTAEPHPGA